MSKWFWLVLALVVGGLVGLFVLFNNDSPAQNLSQNPQEITAADHVLSGDANSPVTLIEYGDFQCPVCKNAAPMLEQLRREYGPRLRFVFRHFPLTSIHPNAFAASRAAEAAASFGKFLEMHNLLYEKQAEWAESPQAQKLFRDYALQLGLDERAFTDAYNQAAVTDRINNDIALGQAQEAAGTPTYILNGQKIETPKSIEEFKAKIEEGLNSS